MKGIELKAARQRIGHGRVAFARLLGYTGSDRNDDTRIRIYESGKKQIPLYIARLVHLITQHHDATGMVPNFPPWSGYEFEHTPDQQHKESDHGFY